MPEPTQYRLQLPSHRLSYYFVTHSHRSGAGHVTTKYRGCQSLLVLYWVGLPSQIYPLIICHQSPTFWCWSFDNSSKYTQGTRAYQPGTGYSYPLTDFLIVTNSHCWSCDSFLTYTGGANPTDYSCPFTERNFLILLSLIPIGLVLVM